MTKGLHLVLEYENAPTVRVKVSLYLCAPSHPSQSAAGTDSCRWEKKQSRLGQGRAQGRTGQGRAGKGGGD